MLIFRSEEHIDRWCAARELPRGGVLSAEQAWRLAQAWYRDRASPTWRRYTVDETEALLGELGLTTAFWELR